MKHTLIKNGSDKLLIFFNDMVRTGEDEFFSYYKTINKIFDDYDILFIKDIQQRLWYLTIVDDVYNLISTIILNNKYKFAYVLTSSSGTICLLNVLPKFDIFKKAVIINGQIALDDDTMQQYKNTCHDCAIFDINYIPKKIKESLLTPFNTIEEETYDKYLFYYCNSVSDLVYYRQIKQIYPESLHGNIFFDDINSSHGEYIAHLFNNHEFLNEIKNTFDKSAI